MHVRDSLPDRGVPSLADHHELVLWPRRGAHAPDGGGIRHGHRVGGSPPHAEGLPLPADRHRDTRHGSEDRGVPQGGPDHLAAVEDVGDGPGRRLLLHHGGWTPVRRHCRLPWPQQDNRSHGPPEVPRRLLRAKGEPLGMESPPKPPLAYAAAVPLVGLPPAGSLRHVHPRHAHAPPAGHLRPDPRLRAVDGLPHGDRLPADPHRPANASALQLPAAHARLRPHPDGADAKVQRLASDR
mmetsp:Transcript_71144/g.219585  ORF Transcript_71144/g.219585 Transcript_71144/m.219585 type:complete len:239 (+) Transcript_71144:436-1152(+)